MLLSGGLDGARVRARPDSTLVEFGALTAEERAGFGALPADPSLYGAWQDDRGSLKVVDHEAAMLLASLRRPRPAADVPADRTSLARLILDGVLEVAVAAGEFLSGSRAFETLCDASWSPASTTATARLSEEALRYANRLDIDDARRLSARLYFFGRKPVSPGWLARFPTASTVERFLGATGPGATARRLARWKAVDPDPTNDGWLTWVRPSAAPAGTDRHKLYVSPHPESSPDGFAAAVEVAEDAGAVALKVGREATALLRPDKIVVYFAAAEDLATAADAAATLLHGCPGQGVPFTAEWAGAAGLLSWGVDPPRSERLIGWQERESWRLWLTNRLAMSVLAARRDGGTVEPWRFAAARVELDGVDTSTWSPNGDPWADE